jgi:hypothetical protein
VIKQFEHLVHAQARYETMGENHRIDDDAPILATATFPLS